MSEAIKMVRIRLAAFTRVEYNEVIAVPADITQEELDDLVNKRYDDVDGGEYHEDPHYWERAGSTGHEFCDPQDSAVIKPERTVIRNAEGKIEIETD